ncbi:MAG: adenosylmethionine--8-amino-7-oxononanoate transaminase [Solirubrobacterales bacterium]
MAAAGRDTVWHPFTQMREWHASQAPLIERGEGVWLVDADGRRYIDGVSSLWCNVHGHRHPTIDAAVRAQLDRVAHTTMLGLRQPLAEQLARRLVEIAPGAGPGAPGALRRVFYSDSGSTSVEVALKMAFQYWQQGEATERRRTRFVCLEQAYHGDTVGSVSVGGIDLFHEMYRPMLFDSIKVPPGDTEALARTLGECGSDVAAVIVEPLVQGAAGMQLQPRGYVRSVRELCDSCGTLLICDEVATGFGRTGTMFACEQEDVVPDFLCVAKGLTGGYLPLAATLTTERVFQGFLGRYDEFRSFFHGHTYTGNPLACAAALASLDVFEQERTLERLQSKIELLDQLLHERIAPLAHVAEVRQRGFMCGVELMAAPRRAEPFGPAANVGHRVTLEARARGAIVRPLGDVIVLMPPLSIDEPTLETLVDITASSIVAATERESLPRAA